MSESESTEKIKPHLSLLTKKIAIDCEMMRSNIGQVLGRVSVVNYNGKIILDSFIYYLKPVHITDTNERFSGIRWADINPQNGARAFSEVQTQLGELLRDRVVIGHNIEKDLEGHHHGLDCSHSAASRRCSFSHSSQRKYANPGARQGPNLKNLALRALGHSIKQGPVSSIDDAVATVEIYRKAEVEINREQEQ
ncbi:ribonuclease H-like domain-containing protein [Bipolaris maydis]|nr:ribonuclease H-like domain-containing protein [Bipolaris maydis]